MNFFFSLLRYALDCSARTRLCSASVARHKSTYKHSFLCLYTREISCRLFTFQGMLFTCTSHAIFTRHSHKHVFRNVSFMYRKTLYSFYKNHYFESTRIYSRLNCFSRWRFFPCDGVIIVFLYPNHFLAQKFF